MGSEDQAISKNKTAAIIAEYNPFHNGHERHIRLTRSITGAENIIVIMSGSFVQRGECAIADKFSRAKAALEGGANLVLELPHPFACAGAEKFAFGGVTIADALDCVDFLSFGAECGDIEKLARIANALNENSLSPLIKKHLDMGKSFARARCAAVRELCGDESADILQQPNNILAIEYIRALKNLNSTINPVAVERSDVLHDSREIHGDFTSAAAIRGILKSKENDISEIERFIPNSSFKIMNDERIAGRLPADLERCERAIIANLRGMSKDEIAELPDISEGLENRIYKAVRSASSLEELYLLIKSKRYSHARIRRIILSSFTGIRASDSSAVPYIRILGMDEQGKSLLFHSSSSLPIIATFRQSRKLPPEAARIYELESHADDMWSLMTPKILPCGRNLTSKPIFIQKQSV